MKNNLQYYIDEVKRQNPGLTDAEINTIANKYYKMDPNSDFKGTRPKADPAFKVFNANAKASQTGTSTAAPSGPTATTGTTGTKDSTVIGPLSTPDLKPIATGVQSNFKKFIDGSLAYNAGGPGSISMEPFITGKSSPEQPNPKPIVILPTADGMGFIVGDLDRYVSDYISRIPSGEAAYYKQQLKNYYSSDKDFRTSLAGGPSTDKDQAFAKAVKAALQEITVNNFTTGQNIGQGLEDGTILQGNSAGFYSFDNWIASRRLTEPISQTSRTSGLTTKADALAEFRRTAQQYVGDLDLINNYDALAEAYWEKLHKEEKARISQSTSITDPITGNTINRGISYTQLSEQDRLEMRVNFITNGAVGKKGKVLSTGIKDVTPLELQDAGGTIGDNYTKLKSYAYDYGVPLSDTQIKQKAAEALLPGGSIDEQKRSIQLASRALYKGLDSYIQAGLKVSDVADQFKKLKTSELELADGAVDIFDADVQAALTGDKLMNPMDYTGLLRQNPNWKFTKKANESAAGLVDTFLKTWGSV